MPDERYCQEWKKEAFPMGTASFSRPAVAEFACPVEIKYFCDAISTSILTAMPRNKQLIEERNRRIADAYYRLEPKLRNYADVVSALSRLFFLSESRVQAIIRQMVREDAFHPSGEARKLAVMEPRFSSRSSSG